MLIMCFILFWKQTSNVKHLNSKMSIVWWLQFKNFLENMEMGLNFINCEEIDSKIDGFCISWRRETHLSSENK